MYQPSEDLLERLASPDVGADDVFEFLRGQEQDLMSPTRGRFNCAGDAYIMPPAPIPVTEFFSAADLDSYRMAGQWWPRMEELPPQFAMPSIYQLCYAYADDTMGRTFADRLTKRGFAVLEWLEDTGRSTANPNETPEEKRARQNREAQRKHRVRKGEAGTPEEQAHERAVKAAYDEWQEFVAQRTESLANHDRLVQEAQEAYFAVCADRKEARRGWDEQVASARAAYLLLKKGPASGAADGSS